MALEKIVTSKSLTLAFFSVDAEGKSITTKKTLANVDISAKDEDIYVVANAISKVLEKPMDEVRINDTSRIHEI